jgi:hypothetical protein
VRRPGARRPAEARGGRGVAAQGRHQGHLTHGAPLHAAAPRVAGVCALPS